MLVAVRGLVRLLRVHSHVNWALADQALVSGANFLTGILLVRFLGVEEFGRFTLAWMVVLFANAMQHAAIVSPMMSFGPKQAEDEYSTYFGTVTIQQIVFSSFVFACVLALVGAVNWVFPTLGADGLILPLACVAFMCQLQEYLRRYFFTHGRPGAAFLNDATRYLGQIGALLVGFQLIEMDTARALWIIAAAGAAAVLLGLPGLDRPHWDSAAWRITLRRHWTFGKWLVGSAVMRWTSQHLFVIIAGALLGTTAVGALRAAQNLMGVTNILFLGLENVVPLKAARKFHRGGRARLVAYLWRVTLFGGLAVGSIAAVMLIAPVTLLTVVYGAQFGDYGFILQWYAVIFLVMFISLPVRMGLRAVERTSSLLWANVGTTLFTLIAAYPLIAAYDVLGVLLGLVVLHSIGFVIVLIGFKKTLQSNSK